MRNHEYDRSRNASEAILDLRQGIVVSVLKRKYGFDGQPDGVVPAEGESLDDYGKRLLAGYRRAAANRPPKQGASEDPIHREEMRTKHKSIWKRVLSFLTLGAYR